MNRRETILQLGAGVLMAPTIRILKEAGYRVLAVDRNPQAPAFAVADGSAAIDIADAEAIAEYARGEGVDLILAVSEFGVLGACQASQMLGLPGLSLDVAMRSLHKGMMRDCWRDAGLRQPRYRTARNADELAVAVDDLGYPVIVKPTMSCGSRGVSLVNGPDDLPWAFEFAMTSATNGELIVEEFISGTEMTIEGVVQEGTPIVLAKSDKEAQDHAKFRVAMALNYPANFPQQTLDNVDELVGSAARALGIERGAFHCECMVNAQGVFLIELAARPGGGHIFNSIVEASSGVAMPVALVQIMLGESSDFTPKYQRGACYRFFAPPPGTFKSVHGIEQARGAAGIIDFGFEMKPGTVVGPIAGDADRPGYVASSGATRQEAIDNALAAIGMLRYEYFSALELEAQE